MVLTWETAADWDSAQSENGVVHESVTNSDHNDATIVKQGYGVATPFKSGATAGYWPMQGSDSGTMYDFSGNNNDGTNFSVTVDVAALLGTTGYSYSPARTDLPAGATGLADLATGDFTVLIWVRVPSGNTGMVLEKREQGGDNSRCIDLEVLTGGTIEVARASGRTCTSTTAIDDGNWHHIAVTHDDSASSEFEIFVDAVSEDTGSENSNYGSANDDFTVGGRMDDSGTVDDQINADMCNLHIVTSVLSASEIQSHYDVVAANGQLTTASKAL